mmetsp:Transcript_6440/g.18387  ORF Transcript_6440/g.18387 Transcript_6440/m.18387 type:complete len:218 (+) Transcript_6440:485-1138(+)
MIVSCSATAWCRHLGPERSCASLRRVSTLSNSASCNDPPSWLTKLKTFSKAPSKPCSSQRCKPSLSSSLRILPSESLSMLSYTSFTRSGLRSNSFSSTFSRRSPRLIWLPSLPRRRSSSTCSTSARRWVAPVSVTRRHQNSALDTSGRSSAKSEPKPSRLSSRRLVKRSAPWSEKCRVMTGVLVVVLGTLLAGVSLAVRPSLACSPPSGGMFPGVPG